MQFTVMGTSLTNQFGKPQDWQDDPVKVAAHAEFSDEVRAAKRGEHPPATEWTWERGAMLPQSVEELELVVNAALSAERKKVTSAWKEVARHDKQLLSAQAAIAEHNKLVNAGVITKPVSITFDLSALDKHVAAQRKPLVDALERIRDEAVTLVEARKYPNSVLHIEAPRRIKSIANDAMAKANINAELKAEKVRAEAVKPLVKLLLNCKRKVIMEWPDLASRIDDALAKMKEVK